MIEVMVRSMLGKSGGALLDWLRSHTGVTTGLLGVLLVTYALGRFQLWRIEQRTAALVLEMSKEWLRQKPNITANGLYRRIYPRWSKAVGQWAWFIPHRWEIWPVPARAETVRLKMSFSPQWIAALLAKHGLSLNSQESEEEND
jgi:hypothetical protein